jgi:hypothetical protein
VDLPGGPLSLEVGCFGPQPGWSEQAWGACTLSQQALIVSLLQELGRRQPGGQPPGPAPAPDWLAAARALLRTLPEARGFTVDDSPFTGAEDYAALSRAEVVRFYAETNPGGRPIAIARAPVQLEAFEWGGGSFRIDVRAPEPAILPPDTCYVMAHRLWMRRSGEVVRSEPVWRASKLGEGAREEALPATSRGFYPG